MFMVDIVFRNLKTNTVDMERASTLSMPSKTLECRLMPPKITDNLIFSIPHRLLVIALRRGLLVGISTTDELLNGSQYNIRASHNLFTPILYTLTFIDQGRSTR
jgi:hypothetical protein